MNSEIRRLGLDASFAAAGNEDQAVSVLCPICHDYMEDAKEVDCEGRHVFCGPCIKNVSDREKPCPFCRGRFSKMERPHALMRTLIEQIKWKCVNFEGGCSFTGTKKQLEKHLDDDCEIQEVKCPFIGCPKKMQRAPLEAHKNSCPYRLVACGHCDEQVCFNSKQTHNKSCPKFPVPCPNKCGKKVLREAVSDHLQKECAEELVDCRVSGCGESVKRKMMEQHEDGNMKKHVKLLHAEVEKMEIFQTEIDKLQSELDKQQEQTKTLHTELDKMKADVDTLKAQSQSRQLQSFSSSTRDILDVFVRLPDFETRSAGMQKGHGQYLESTSFLFQVRDCEGALSLVYRSPDPAWYSPSLM
uniref:RING-type domain-containing protein n=1 Tax=Chromera velia CCMP2878 TaxID=1169474 RepID=A0A0G4HYR8_9ALVE|eukprot:Cvel_9542.t1-p1 / transcript=Cvel_9542.t1 / gene=Cvel_9542 / organism=Chromera_velia_CCMP2878 / gene_product=TNF receptor-associated factor family protein, putative / transcript_product=TNF receptor-associated factor family protein, putative / location=Cvel_scaffold553:173-1450(-) / protein_length=356 / sequence_SO=supercontig / SO=protein_coding / is_pseudo=false